MLVIKLGYNIIFTPMTSKNPLLMSFRYNQITKPDKASLDMPLEQPPRQTLQL